MTRPGTQRATDRRPAAEGRTTGRAAARRPARPVSPERYRRRRLAAALLALLLLVGLGLTGRILLFDVGLADVEDVRVGGTSLVPADEVVAAAAVTPGGPLAAVDTGGIAERVAQLPGVASADVGRDWLHTVTVEVVERVPVAVVQTPQGPALVDATGAVFRRPAPPGLPALTVRAPGPEDPSTLAAVGVLTALPDAVRSQVLTADATVAAPGAQGQVVLGLTGDRQVRWGAPERTADKAAALVPLLTRPGRTYDVTSPDLPTVGS